MARRKKSGDGEAAVEIVPGTVEYAAREHFEREKAAYEERTGIPCNYVPPHPLTSTPLPDAAAEPELQEETDAGGEPETDPEPEDELENDEGDAQGDE